MNTMVLLLQRIQILATTHI